MTTLTFRTALGLICLGSIALATTADAQRRSGGDFEGTWKGTLSMDAVYDVPEGDVDRLSKPVDFELRIFSRGGAELYFTGDEREWNLAQQRDFRITLVGDDNAVIVARIPGSLPGQNNFALNMTKQGDDALLLNWSRLSVRNELLFDGLDGFALAGTAQLQKAD